MRDLRWSGAWVAQEARLDLLPCVLPEGALVLGSASLFFAGCLRLQGPASKACALLVALQA